MRFDGEPIAASGHAPAVRRRVQMVFQHPAQSLNPRFTVAAMLAEPLELADVTRNRSEIDARIDATLQLVGLGSAIAQAAVRRSSPAASSNVSPSPAP